jgi:hypothetical protein
MERMPMLVLNPEKRWSAVERSLDSFRVAAYFFGEERAGGGFFHRCLVGIARLSPQ